MEAVLSNLDNSIGPASQSRARNSTTGGLSNAHTDTRVNKITEAHFNAAMEAVINEPIQRRTYSADISDEVSTQDANILNRNNTENRINNNSENNLNFSNHVLIENELPDIDQPISDESYPSISAFLLITMMRFLIKHQSLNRNGTRAELKRVK
jgi:hypothetical protein